MRTNRRKQASTSSTRPLISIVVPCFNEEQALPNLYHELTRVMATRPDVDCEFILVNDGSSDRTAEILEELVAADSRVTAITLSRNFGQQPAISAGLARARGDAVILCDADLQDSPGIMPQMIDRWHDGAEVVYAVRARREAVALKRAAYRVFYRVLKSISEVHMPLDSGDFSLMDRKVVDAINDLPEANRFVRGLRAWVGYTQTPLQFDRPARIHGKTKYSFARMMRLACDGVFDFSTKPLTIIFILGLIVSMLSFGGIVFFLAHRLIGFKVLGHSPEEVPGITSVVLAVFFFGGVQLLALGVVGEYIGRIHREVKRRPSFIVKSVNGQGTADAPQGSNGYQQTAAGGD